MDKSQEVLKKFAASKSKYFNLPDNEEVQVKFLYAEVVPNNFDGGKTDCIRYHLEVDGVEKMWDRTSQNLSQQMSQLSEGDLIFIRKEGERSKTRYFIRKVDL